MATSRSLRGERVRRGVGRPASESRLGRLIPLALVLLSAAGLAIHAAYYLPFISDDALISLRYAQRWLQGQGLTWSAGERVEGYSNLLWIVAMALPGKLGMELVEAVRLLGFLGMTGVAVVVTVWYARVRAAGESWLPLAVGLFLFTLSGPIAIWVVGGLEQPLVAVLLAAAIPLAFRVMEAGEPARSHLLLLSALLGLLCLTRLDGLVFALSMALVLVPFWYRHQRGRLLAQASMLAAFPFLCCVGQSLFRLVYYGEMVPNTALVKFSPSATHLVDGVRYLGQGLLALSSLAVIGLLSVGLGLRTAHLRRRMLLLVALFLGWAVYLVAIGGDIFPGWRHHVSFVVIFTFASVEGLREAWARRAALSRRWRTLGLAGLALLLLAYPAIQFHDWGNRRAKEELWEWRGEVLGRILRTAFSRQQPLTAVTAAGCVPYWSELPSLDMMGLNDHYIARQRPADFGEGAIGHELGSGAYVLARRPDLIVFHIGAKALVFRSGEELGRSPEFHAQYVPVKLHVPTPRPYVATLWVRRDSPRIGLRQTGSGITVPGYLLTANPKSMTALTARGGLAVLVQKGQPAGVRLAPGPAAPRSVTIASPTPQLLRTSVSRDARGLSLWVSTDAETPVEVEGVTLATAGGGPRPGH